jgi:CBS domain-containing protein
MRIVDIPGYRNRKQLLTLEKSTLLVDAARKMKELNYGAVIVTENNRLCGIFTERDLLMKVVAEGRELKGLKLQDVMTSAVKTANENDEISDSMRRMSEGRFRHLPIVNDQGEATGIISQGDFVSVTWQELFQQLKTKTTISFLSYTQLWILIICVLIYSTGMILFVK